MAPPLAPSSGGKGDKSRKGKRPLLPAATTASEKARPSAQPDRVTAPSRVGGCLALHWRQWQAVGAEPWVVSVLRHGYRIPFQDRLPSLSRSPVNFPTYPPKSPKAGGRGHDIQERFGESGRPGSRLLQSPFLGGKGLGRLETLDRPLSPQRVREANPIQNGDCLLSPPLSKRGRLPSIHRPEGRLLPGARPSLLPEVAPFRLGRIGPPVPSPLLQIINRPSGLHTCVRHSVGLGPLPWSPPPPVPRRLAGPGLFRGQGQTACQGPLVAVPLPRDNAQRQDVRTGPLTGSGVPRHDNRHGGSPSVPHHDSNRQTPLHWEEIPCTPVPQCPAVTGVVGTHVMAGEVSPPRETQDALTPVSVEDTLVPPETDTPPPPPPFAFRYLGPGRSRKIWPGG